LNQKSAAPDRFSEPSVPSSHAFYGKAHAVCLTVHAPNSGAPAADRRASPAGTDLRPTATTAPRARRSGWSMRGRPRYRPAVQWGPPCRRPDHALRHMPGA
jgi:hypothetical protein